MNEKIEKGIKRPLIKKRGKRGGKRPGSGRKPGTQNKATVSLKGIAQEYTAEAIDVLAEIMRDPESPAAARVAAADKLLDRAYGKPRQELEVSGEVISVDRAALRERYEKNMSKTIEYARQAEERREMLRNGVLL
jgi:hypothetical protein